MLVLQFIVTFEIIFGKFTFFNYTNFLYFKCSAPFLLSPKQVDRLSDMILYLSNLNNLELFKVSSNISTYFIVSLLQIIFDSIVPQIRKLYCA